MNNQRGGILSKLFIVPAGVALMVGFFFLGYYVGKYQSKSTAQSEAAPPLPEVASKNSRTQEEFTFYKTLTDKENKTVSIDLKPAPAKEQAKAENKQVAEPPKTAPAQPAQKEKTLEIKLEKNTSSAEKEADKPRPAKKEAAPNTKLRYTVQIASYPEKEMADDEVRKLKRQGYAAFVASSEIPGKGMWHRVRLGSFSNKAAAEKLQRDLRAKESISSIIVIE